MAQNMNESPVTPVTVERPEAGETLTVLTASGLQIVLAFDPADARFGVEGDDFILSFEDGAGIVFQGLVTAAQGADAPTIRIAGIDIDAGALMEQIQALAGQAKAEPIETAAGEQGEGAEASAGAGGGSTYDDFLGDVIDLLIQQGVIGETELGFGLIAGENIELPVDTAGLSNGHASAGAGFDPLDAGSPSETPSESSVPEVTGDLVPSTPPVSDSDSDEDGEIDGELESLDIYGMDIITNEATGNLQIPDELILYLANKDEDEDVSVYLADQDVELSISGPSYDGGTDNAHIWAVPGEVLADAEPFNTDAEPFNTWADDGNGHVRFHIGGVGPLYQGSFTYQVVDGEGATGGESIGVRNVETENVRSYWTLDRWDSEEGEVLLGQDGRNIITGGKGDDIIHGGHDASGDILMGNDGSDVIFGGAGNDDLQGGAGDDTFLMSAGFGRDDVDGGEEGIDTIALDGVLTQDEVDDLSSWLTLDSGHSITGIADGVISLSADASGTIDLGGGNVISFLNIEQIDYANVA